MVEKQSFKEQLVENKKMLMVLGAVVVFGGYMLLPSNESVETNSELDSQLADLQASRDGGSVDNDAPRAKPFDGTDRRGISLGGGDDVDDPGAFQTGPPLVTGTIVGFGTKTDFAGEYLVAYISVKDTSGYEIDMRDIVGYDTRVPVYLGEGKDVRVYGDFMDDMTIKAQVVQ